MCITWLSETRQVPTISEHRGWIMFKRFMLGIWWAVKAKHIVAFNLIHHRCWDMSSSIQGLMVPLPLGSCTDSWLNLFGWLHILRSALTLRAQFSPNGLSSASAWVITLQPPLRKVFFSTWQRIASSLECFMFRDLSDKRNKLTSWVWRPTHPCPHFYLIEAALKELRFGNFFFFSIARIFSLPYFCSCWTLNGVQQGPTSGPFLFLFNAPVFLCFDSVLLYICIFPMLPLVKLH